jgi:hypothetical protein
MKSELCHSEGKARNNVPEVICHSKGKARNNVPEVSVRIDTKERLTIKDIDTIIKRIEPTQMPTRSMVCCSENPSIRTPDQTNCRGAACSGATTEQDRTGTRLRFHLKWRENNIVMPSER